MMNKKIDLPAMVAENDPLTDVVAEMMFNPFASNNESVMVVGSEKSIHTRIKGDTKGKELENDSENNIEQKKGNGQNMKKKKQKEEEAEEEEDEEDEEGDGERKGNFQYPSGKYRPKLKPPPPSSVTSFLPTKQSTNASFLGDANASLLDLNTVAFDRASELMANFLEGNNNEQQQQQNQVEDVTNSEFSSTVTSVASNPSLSPGEKNGGTRFDDPDALLHGEVLQLKIAGVYFVSNTRDAMKGVLIVTSYQIRFIPDPQDYQAAHTWCYVDPEYFKIPLGCVSKVSRNTGGSIRSRGREMVILSIYCKDLRHVQIKFDDGNVAIRAEKLIVNLAFPLSMDLGLQWLFAFTHFNPSAVDFYPIGDVDLMLDWKRQGVFHAFSLLATNNINNNNNTQNTQQRWRVTNVNFDFRFCQTYPNQFIVPALTTDDQLYHVADFRSKCRIPTLCWFNERNGGSIWRCSQPKVGIGNASPFDEAMVEAIRLQTPYQYVRIIDCRPYKNAVANKAKGMGYEDETRYQKTRLAFENIQNIHVVRSSYKQLGKVLATECSNAPANNFLEKIEQTGWLNHLRTVLSAGIKLANYVGERGLAVLVHCSDGWDRTPQVVSIAQLLLDPYYRTLDGFRVLIEREWVMFGHRFRDRNGHGSQDEDSEEISPVFLQFIDCVWQLYNQFPSYFEFNSKLLFFIAQHQFSCRFGNFLCNYQLQRIEEDVYKKTPSIWNHIMANKDLFLNPYFDTVEDTILSSSQRDGGMLIPRLHVMMRHVTLWYEFYLPESLIPTRTDELKDRTKSLLWYKNKVKELEERIGRLQEEFLRPLQANRNISDEEEEEEEVRSQQ